MTDFLEQVVAERRAYVADARTRRPLETTPVVGDFVAGVGNRFDSALIRAREAGVVAVIAEVKRVSPALGALAAPTFDAVEQARRYVAAGATAISVLTEPRHWGGSLEDLSRIRSALPDVPLLCKDVIVDEYQIVQAKQAGADAVLLIAEALTDAELRTLVTRVDVSSPLGLLVEAHEPHAFARAVALGRLVVGVNARNLRRPAEIDPRRVHDLAPLVRKRQILVAESGIGSAEDARRLPPRVNAVLVGSALMRGDDPGALIRSIAALPRAVPA
jgi:indole-3-glycerol phosphate synthase